MITQDTRCMTTCPRSPKTPVVHDYIMKMDLIIPFFYLMVISLQSCYFACDECLVYYFTILHNTERLQGTAVFAYAIKSLALSATDSPRTVHEMVCVLLVLYKSRVYDTPLYHRVLYVVSLLSTTVRTTVTRFPPVLRTSQ